MQKIVPNLWFDGNAKEAVDYYMSVFADGKIITTTYYPDSQDDSLAEFQQSLAGKILTIEFEILDMKFIAINAGPEFKFNGSVSFMINCKDQVEIDYYWDKLSAAPEAEQCGWCKDKFGLSWQIIPEDFDHLMKKPGAFATLMKQNKIIINKF